MPQIQGGKGEAVVFYREPLTTSEMQYPRLSRRVNNMAGFGAFLDSTQSELQQEPSKPGMKLHYSSSWQFCHVIYATIGSTVLSENYARLANDVNRSPPTRDKGEVKSAR